jgi:hypothetical protein
MTKYADNDDPNIGFIELQPEDDAATANWGSGWQMPSLDQIVELYNSDYTTTTWITQYGSDGILVTSKSNGKSIFLPAAGFRSDSNPYFPGSYGYYWSRSLHTGYSNSAYDLYFFSSDISWERSNRYLGLPVRPVRVDNYKYVLGIYLDYTSLYLKPDNTMQLTATVWPLDAANRTVTWKSSNTSIATVDKVSSPAARMTAAA